MEGRNSRFPSTGNRAKPTMPAYQALAQDIGDLGAETAFRLTSDDTVMLALDSLGVDFHEG